MSTPRARTRRRSGDVPGDDRRRARAAAPERRPRAACWPRRPRCSTSSGAVATSVRDITGACGLSPGALYRHFASKDDMLYALVRHGHARLEQRVGHGAGRAAGRRRRGRAHAAPSSSAYVLGHLVSPELAQVVRREYLHLSERRATARSCAGAAPCASSSTELLRAGVGGRRVRPARRRRRRHPRGGDDAGHVQPHQRLVRPAALGLAAAAGRRCTRPARCGWPGCAEPGAPEPGLPAQRADRVRGWRCRPAWSARPRRPP